MRLLCLIVILAASTPAAAQTKLFQDFRGGMFDDDALIYAGMKPEKYLTREKEGLRLRYTGEGAPPSNQVAGVIWRFHARGDFSATVRYEILQVKRPATVSGVGPELHAFFKTPAKDAVALARLMFANGDPVLRFHHHATDPQGLRPAGDIVRKPVDEKSLRGSLRLARNGTILIASFASGDEAEFQVIQRIEIGNADVEVIRVAGVAANDPAAVLDMRLLDFELSGDDLAYKKGRGFKTPAPKQPPAGPVQIAEARAVQPAAIDAAPAAPASRSNLVLLAVVVAGFMIPLGLIVGVILFMRSRRAAVSVD